MDGVDNGILDKLRPIQAGISSAALDRCPRAYSKRSISLAVSRTTESRGLSQYIADVGSQRGLLDDRGPHARLLTVRLLHSLSITSPKCSIRAFLRPYVLRSLSTIITAFTTFSCDLQSAWCNQNRKLYSNNVQNKVQ
jgi:hypothetical protein